MRNPMRTISILLLCILVATPAHAYRIAAGSNTIPTAFSASDVGSQVGSCRGNVVEIINYTTAPLAIGFGSSSAVPSGDYAYVPAGASGGPGTGRYKPKGGTDSAQYVYIRAADGSTATASSVFIACYYEEKP